MTYTLSQVTESIGTITLDHERRRNALSHALVEEVIAALRSFQEAKVRVVILRAKPGAKVFSAGHDGAAAHTRSDQLTITSASRRRSVRQQWKRKEGSPR